MSYIKGSLHAFFVLGTAIIITYILIIALTLAVIDPYLHATNRYVNYFDLYEDHSEYKIYFVGNSYTEYGVNASEIEQDLNDSYKVYNLGIGGDTPKHRIVELDRLIDSKPMIVMLDISYGSFRNDQAFSFTELKSHYGFATDEINLDKYSKQLFNETELNYIEQSCLNLLAYKRQLLIPASRMAIANKLISLGVTDVGFLHAEKPNKFTFKVYNFKDLSICNKTKEEFAQSSPYIVQKQDNNNKKAFRYMIKKMRDHGIHVILINMPLNPNFSAWISNESRRNYSDIVINQSCPYYNLEALCAPIEFRDHGHSNILGQKNITKRMGEILKIEIGNASLHRYA